MPRLELVCSLDFLSLLVGLIIFQIRILLANFNFLSYLHLQNRSRTWSSVGYSYSHQSSHNFHSFLVNSCAFYLFLSLCSTVTSRPIFVSWSSTAFNVLIAKHSLFGKYFHWISSSFSGIVHIGNSIISSKKLLDHYIFSGIPVFGFCCHVWIW